ncbi:MAG: hypothetical protein R2746_04120 [Acidimicrobiales bacterium]
MTNTHSEDEMNYLILIYQGTTPTPPSPEWDALPEEQKQAECAPATRP